MFTRHIVVLLLLPLPCFAQPEIGIKLGYTGASLHASHNWNKKQVSLFAEAAASGPGAHIAAGLLINFKEKEKKARLYGGVGVGYAAGRYYPRGSTTIGVNPSNPSPMKVSYSPEDQKGLLLRSQCGFNFKMGRHMFFNIEVGIQYVIASYNNYYIFPANLGLSYCFNKEKKKKRSNNL